VKLVADECEMAVELAASTASAFAHETIATTESVVE